MYQKLQEWRKFRLKMKKTVFSKYSYFRCAPDWESNKHIVYTIYWLVTGFLIPLFVILYSSYKTTRQMRNQTNFTRSENVKRMSQKREKKICALVIWMNIAFLVCWMPYGVICFMYIFGGRGYVSPSVVVIPLLAAKTSVCWNPIIYIAMNPQVTCLRCNSLGRETFP